MRSGFQKIVDQMEPLFQALLASVLHTPSRMASEISPKGAFTRSTRMAGRYTWAVPTECGPAFESTAQRAQGKETVTFAYKLTLEAVGEQGGHSSEFTREQL